MVALLLVLTLGQAEMEISDRPVRFMTRRDLKAEYADLEARRPGIGAPIAMISVGLGLIGYGGIFMLSSGTGPGGIGGLFSAGNQIGYVFVTMLVMGAGLLFPGIWLWWTRKDDRAASGARMDEISARLEELEREEPRPVRRPRSEEPDVPDRSSPDVQNYQL